MGDSTTIALNLTFFGTLGLAFLMFLGLVLLVVITLLLAVLGRLSVLAVMALFGRLPKNETIPLVRLTGESGPPSLSDGTGHAAVPALTGPSRAAALRAKAAALPRAAVTALSAARAHSTAAVVAVSGSHDWRTALRDGRNLLRPSELRPRFHDAVEYHPLFTAARKEPEVLAEDWAAAVAEADARAMARARAAAPDIKIPVRNLPCPSVSAAKVEAVAPLVEALHQDNPSREKSALGGARSFTKPPTTEPLSLLDTGSLVSLAGHTKVLKAKLPADRH